MHGELKPYLGGIAVAVAVGDEDFEGEKKQAQKEVKEVLDDLARDYPGITEGLAACVGSTLGTAGSLTALYFLGTTGFSAVGISSGLATAGGIVAAGMLGGIVILTIPAALAGVAFYAIAKKRKNTKMAASLGLAIKKLYEIQERLMQNAEFFKEEIAEIKAMIAFLQRKDEGKTPA